MRLLARIVDRPYVLHLWDSFSGPLLENHDLTWLVRNAAKIFVVSDALADDVRSLGVEPETLLFSRPSSALTASSPGSGPLRIALLGTIDPYADGVLTLDDAIGRLAKEGIEIQPVFVGSERAVAKVNRRLSRPLVPTGFLSDVDRDRVLAGCHLGFLPGPGSDPGSDMRSRYSIPSRSMDFLAVGLPAVGVLHPRSAARRFYEHLGLDDLVAQSGPQPLAAQIRRLVDPETWRAEHERVQATWNRLRLQNPSEQLFRAVDELA